MYPYWGSMTPCWGVMVRQWAGQDKSKHSSLDVLFRIWTWLVVAAPSKKQTTCGLVATNNSRCHCRVIHLQFWRWWLHWPYSKSAVDLKASSHNNMLLQFGVYSLIVGAARTSCSGWMVHDSDCLGNGSEAWREEKTFCIEKLILCVKCSEIMFPSHPVETAPK